MKFTKASILANIKPPWIQSIRGGCYLLNFLDYLRCFSAA